MHQEQTTAAEPDAGEKSSLEAELADIDAREVLASIGELAREHPHAALAGAAALGFVLGGGLTPRVLAMVGTFAGRRYANRVLREVLASAAR